MTLQPAGVLFEDAEVWAYTYLRAALDARPEMFASGVFVGRGKPDESLKPYPTRLVTVRRDGGLTEGVFDIPRLSFRVWADDEGDAASLAMLVRSLLMVAPISSYAGTAKSVTSTGGPYAVADDGPQFLKFLSVEVTLHAVSSL